MVSGVLTLGERSIRSTMTPRTEISWIDVGVSRAKDLLANIMDTGIIGDLCGDPVQVKLTFS